jgi:hypothetical protein
MMIPPLDQQAILPSCRIRVALPDDGTDRHLVDALRREHAITRVESIAVRAVAALQEQKSKRGRLPEPRAAKLVTIIVDEGEADEIFDWTCNIAAIDRPGGGIVMMDRLLGATPYQLPAGVPDEDT